MSTKVSVRAIVADHFGTLYDARTGKHSRVQMGVHLAAPLALGAGVALLGFRLADVGHLIAGAAVMTGFTFALLVFVFELRMHSANDRFVGRYTQDQIDELFHNVAYALLVGVAGVAAAVTAVVLVPPGGQPVSVLGPWWTGFLVALAIHYVVVMGMCAKRTHAAYVNMVR